MRVLLLYEITLFSNTVVKVKAKDMFYYLTKLHYSQTMLYFVIVRKRFYYLMKLHYSQTSSNRPNRTCRFYYLIKLHYSQTAGAGFTAQGTFYYLIKLHYSQTLDARGLPIRAVLLPYKITLFSNAQESLSICLLVLLPYKITLFSNKILPTYIGKPVLLPYKITLFSNAKNIIIWDLQFYYLIKLHYSQTYPCVACSLTCFTTL